MAPSTTTVAVPSFRRRIGYHAGLLGGVCFLVSALLIIGHNRTAGPIAQRLEEDRRALLRQVLPVGRYDNNPLRNTLNLDLAAHRPASLTVYVASSQGQPVALAFESVEAGYSGDIRLLVGVDIEGEILGVRVIQHTETPGLGDKIEIDKDDWITDFNGRSLANTPASQWRVRKDGGDFDQFTGATITPRAVVKAVHRALENHSAHIVPALAGRAAEPEQSLVSEGQVTSPSEPSPGAKP